MLVFSIQSIQDIVNLKIFTLRHSVHSFQSVSTETENWWFNSIQFNSIQFNSAPLIWCYDSIIVMWFNLVHLVYWSVCQQQRARQTLINIHIKQKTKLNTIVSQIKTLNVQKNREPTVGTCTEPDCNIQAVKKKIEVFYLTRPHTYNQSKHFLVWRKYPERRHCFC
jgi:hypothetical protein